MNSNLKALNIGDLTAGLPIIQGGMGVGISLSGLASAVANEGGVGVIAAASIGMSEPNFASDFVKANILALKKEIRRARQMTKGILGVNVMVALTNFADMVKTAIDEGIDIIFSGAGLPLNLPEYLKKNARTKLAPIVSSPRAAAVITKHWVKKYNYLPDAFVVEGPLAGGHLGFNEAQLQDSDYTLENLIPQVVAEVKVAEEKYQKSIPVIAAGGIYSGADIHKFLKLGASGVQMATRFVTTDECDAAPEFKKAYLESKEEDLVIIKSPVGMLGRAIKNRFINEVAKGKKKPFKCPFHCIRTCDYQKSPYCIALALINAQRGNLKQGFAFSGVNAYRAKEIIPVKKLINSLIREYKASRG
jgi:NAD(P)H-dependent flavin oxidoreductase YrpB (nitropropane dioxygenase family)